MLFLQLRIRNKIIIEGRRGLIFWSRWIATFVSVILAGLFVTTLPSKMMLGDALKASDVHLASAGIIGTALALVLSLSIVPAQKAADVFSSAILKLYARDRRTLGVFGLLSCTALLSLSFGTGWTFYLNVRYALGAQFILLGISLDALRAFYIRALNLLDPETALHLVKGECDGYIRRTRDEVERLVKIQFRTSDDEVARATFRVACYDKSRLSQALNGWTNQLEEFARKGIARRDTQAVNAVIRCMAEIGRNYAEARRNSMVLQHDFSGGIPVGVSDIGKVLNPIYESVKAICEDAMRQPNEIIVQKCLGALGNMAAHAMTMSENSRRTTPLAFSPVFYLELCTKAALAAGMEDALLTAVDATRTIFSKITCDTDAHSAEQKLLDILVAIASASYSRQAAVSCYKSVETMLLAAHYEIRVRGYRRTESLLNAILPKIATLVQLEVVMDKAGQRRMQTFPPYYLGFEASIPMLLAEIASQVKPMDSERSWVDPFLRFNEASKAIVHHYRNIANVVVFDGVLLEKWVVDSLITAAEVHIRLLDSPPTGSDAFLESVDVRLSWLLHAPAFFFQEETNFPYSHASEACRTLATLGMGLLLRQRFESAQACGQTIRTIASNSAKAANTGVYTSAYGFADCIVTLELLARAADALGNSAFATKMRENTSLPNSITTEEQPAYTEAIKTRMGQMEGDLRERDRPYEIEHNPVTMLRHILRDSRAKPASPK